MQQSPVKLWRNQKRIRRLLGQEGTITTWTMIYVPPHGFSSFAPYPIAVVALDSGETITAQVVDHDETTLRVGQRVVVVLRRIMEPSSDGVIPYGVKVKPL